MGKWRKAVKAAFNLVKNCKALWKGVRPKCLKSIRCATTIVTQCLNKKACRVGAIKKIHQCAVREGMAPLKRPARERRVRNLPSAPPERPQEISPDSQLLEPLSSNSAPESSDPKSNAHARTRPSA